MSVDTGRISLGPRPGPDHRHLQSGRSDNEANFHGKIWDIWLHIIGMKAYDLYVNIQLPSGYVKIAIENGH